MTMKTLQNVIINIKVEQYFDYRKKCEELAAKLGIKIEEIDQFLYQIDKKTGASIDSVYIYDTPNNE